MNSDWGLDREALERRRGKGAKVALEELDAQGVLDVEELLGWYADELRATGQDGEAHRIGALAADARAALPDGRAGARADGSVGLDGIGSRTPMAAEYVFVDEWATSDGRRSERAVRARWLDLR